MGKRARAYQATAESACWWWPHRQFVMVSDRPQVIHRDERGRLHSESGPAIAWGDGFGVYAWHGVRVPLKVIEAPETLTMDKIAGEGNAEVRRVMIERVGRERYISEGGAQIIHRDLDGLGHHRRLLLVPRLGDTPMVMVEVLNSTPEPDGSVKTYHLRVPPTMRTCQEAVAWTFNARSNDYAPVVET